jgi:hypothetical protein
MVPTQESGLTSVTTISLSIALLLISRSQQQSSTWRVMLPSGGRFTNKITKFPLGLSSVKYFSPSLELMILEMPSMSY